MKKITKLLLIFVLAFSMILLSSCGSKKKKDDGKGSGGNVGGDGNENPPSWFEGDGVEGPIVDA